MGFSANPQAKSDLVPLQPKHIMPLEKQPTNFLMALMKALQENEKTESKEQMTDAQSTEFAVNLEEKLYTYWNGKLDYWVGKINSASKSKVSTYQSDYSEAHAEASANQSQQDGAVQADQQQTSADASNLQMQAQMIPGVTSILDALVNMLGRITA